jgi:hypothetical protein
MILIRFILISLIVYLIMRSFMRLGEENTSGKRSDRPENKGKAETKKISKNVGEYVDFEEINNNDF